MNSFDGLAVWKEAPFIRLLLPLMAGILIQWYIGVSYAVMLFAWVAVMLLLLILFYSPLKFRFRFAYVIGFLMNLLILLTGLCLSYYKNISNDTQWIGKHYKDSVNTVLLIQDPLSEKANSYKTLATVTHLIDSNQVIPVTGKVIIYLEKDSAAPYPVMGDIILIRNKLQLIKNSGNPGAFDYQRYCAFQNIHHQVFLRKTDWRYTGLRDQQRFSNFLVRMRTRIVATIQRFINGEREAGLAEALLIGYKEDLDKTLVQAYSNTGVVHVIAISGLHVGIIYWLLSSIFQFIFRHKKTKWINAGCVIAGLWLFALLAGGSASVLRSAVMFTCIAVGDTQSKKISIYNSLAASAFLLLCYNPFWLWDVGFQLSYIAVLSIVLFNKPVYDIIYVSNKLLDKLWKLTAVTISAQLLTTPISIFYFHQFPMSFLLSNLIAIPISSLILFGELLLCLFSFITPVAEIIGWSLTKLIQSLNFIIEYIDRLPFSTWQNLSISFLQVCCLYGIIIGIYYWLLSGKKPALIAALICILGVVLHRAYQFREVNIQNKLIVYNISRTRAMDFIHGNTFTFVGDSAAQHNDQLYNFNLRPSRLFYRALTAAQGNITPDSRYFYSGATRILIIDPKKTWRDMPSTVYADILIISGNPRVSMEELRTYLSFGQVVIDASNSFRNATKWKEQCVAAGISCHYVSEHGAFVKNLP